MLTEYMYNNERAWALVSLWRCSPDDVKFVTGKLAGVFLHNSMNALLQVTTWAHTFVVSSSTTVVTLDVLCRALIFVVVVESAVTANYVVT